jgi:molecular chaperone GrpE
MAKKNNKKNSSRGRDSVPTPTVESSDPMVAVDPSAQVTAQAVGQDTEAVADNDTTELHETIARLEAELAEARQECADITEKSQRLAAEFQNSRRRQERQLAEEMERVSAHIIKRLLPVLDDFDLAFANAPDSADLHEAWIEGFRQIQRKLRNMLEDEGVAPILTEGVFDPTQHEAIASAPSDDVESGHILETLRSGYSLKGRVLRPALVRVAL